MFIIVTYRIKWVNNNQDITKRDDNKERGGFMMKINITKSAEDITRNEGIYDRNGIGIFDDIKREIIVRDQTQIPIIQK